MPFKVNLAYLPLYTAIENRDVLNRSLKHYDECEKYKNLTESYDNSVAFEIPDELLMDKIIQQVEFLFSDANILKDKFLLKHIRRNKEGYVSLKLVSSLRKVKALTKDWRVVAYSLQKSQKLQLNDEMTKIKRRDPVPRPKMLDPSRSVLVFHYLPSCWSADTLNKQLKMLGSVVFLEIVDSTADLWYVALQKTLSFYQKIATLPFAIVMFETPDEAANAVLQTSHPSSIILKIVPVLEDEVFKKSSRREKNEYPLKSTEFPSQGSFGSKISRFGNIYSKNEFYSSMPNFFPSATAGKCTLYNDDKSQGDTLLQCMLEEKRLPTFPYKGDGPDNNRGYQRKSCFRKHKDARVIILRQPKGPDGTIGFWKPIEQKNFS